MADVATASNDAVSADSTPSQWHKGNGREMKIEREGGNEQVSSVSGPVDEVPVSREGEEGTNERPPPSYGGRARGGGSRKRKRREMEGGRNKWVSRREASPKRKKVYMIPE